MKVVREHYLRDDVYCSYPACEKCETDNSVFTKNPSINSDSINGKYLIIPDSNVVLHQVRFFLKMDVNYNFLAFQMDVLEDASIRNVIILQTVFDEVMHRSAIAYKKLKDCLSNPDKRFYLFMNEFHK